MVVTGNQSQVVYDKLRRLLLHSGLAEGVRLTESEWADRLGVNRGSLREALMVLAQEGLLERGERGGYFVPRLRQEDVEHILAAREVLESGAIRALAGRPPSADHFDAMERVCDRMQLMLEEGYEFGFVEADRRFHVLLVQSARNPKLSRLYENAPLPIRTSPLDDPEQRRQSGQVTVDEHRRLLRLLREERYDDAIALLRRHLLEHHRAHVLARA